MQRESQERRHRETRQGGKRQKISHGCSTRPHGACARLQQPRRGPGLYNGQPPTPHPQPHSTTLVLLTVPCAVALGTWFSGCLKNPETAGHPATAFPGEVLSCLLSGLLGGYPWSAPHVREWAQGWLPSLTEPRCLRARLRG